MLSSSPACLLRRQPCRDRAQQCCAPARSTSRAIANGDFLAGVGGAIVTQTPRRHVLRLAVGHTYDHIAIPRPGMLAIILAGLRRMIGVRRIPADYVPVLVASRSLRVAHILGGEWKKGVRRGFATVSELE